jgi:hypothetical protein
LLKDRPADFIQENRIRSAKMRGAAPHCISTACAEFACKNKAAYCKEQCIADGRKFHLQRQQGAARMTTNNNEHQCARRSIPAQMSGYARINAFDLIRSFVTAPTQPTRHSEIACSCGRLSPAVAWSAA